ncbi:cobalt-precorrin-6A reductase [Microvirga pudoricolor]|uniref:cobalt-precorrin-6A reductase n=1 Tax=Microvirga pudoricolor TaxID=2778729 RepID=UPI00194E3079|nr:cobalt-precorrin-6A reductase [Microvirga pudoricolor]MBM6592902.1 cobalt-precorrin-6A reductase [Microvirga pudoricolor]
MRILILGGTTEGLALAEALAQMRQDAVMLSLAGRTAAPRRAEARTRIGGFGGVEGLRRWLRENLTDLVIDATHPFAARISANAAQACEREGIPLMAIRRPPWTMRQGDRWIEATSMAEAAEAVGPEPRRVFLTVGRLELDAFNRAPQHHYLVRTIEPVGDALRVPRVTTLQARGPFDEATEEALLAEHGIEVVVTKNSGGPATYGKIAAARRLGLPVVVVSQPDKPVVPTAATVAEAMALIKAHGRTP